MDKKTLEFFWEEFRKTPFNDDGKITEAFAHFDVGTDITVIWDWFETKGFDVASRIGVY